MKNNTLIRNIAVLLVVALVCAGGAAALLHGRAF